MAKYYCILFDADNTLLDFDAAESTALADTLRNYGIEPDAETVQTYRTINGELWRQLDKGQIRRDKLMAERFTRFLKAVNAAGSGAEMNQYYLDQLSTHPLVQPEPRRKSGQGLPDLRDLESRRAVSAGHGAGRAGQCRAEEPPPSALSSCAVRQVGTKRLDEQQC